MLRDFAFRVDQERLPIRHAQQSGQAAHHAVRFGDGFVGVGQQRERQVAFFTKLCVRRARVGADPDHGGTQGFEFGQRLLEFVGLDAASGVLSFG